MDVELPIAPVLRHTLADELAQRVSQMIQSGAYTHGDRLPAISAMARHFAVGAPTLREALRKLETVGVIEIRHGSGVYVGRQPDSLVITNPVHDGAFSKKLLVDLIEARLPIELQSATLAATHATDEHLRDMRELLARASESLDDDALLNRTNLAFHRAIAVASGNVVLRQLLEVLSNLFQEQQRMILGIHGSRRHDHAEHLAILDALERRDPAQAAERMRAHLDGVREVLLRWDPETTPVPGAALPAGATPRNVGVSPSSMAVQAGSGAPTRRGSLPST